jgi:hypothetical protein
MKDNDVLLIDLSDNLRIHADAVPVCSNQRTVYISTRGPSLEGYAETMNMMVLAFVGIRTPSRCSKEILNLSPFHSEEEDGKYRLESLTKEQSSSYQCKLPCTVFEIFVRGRLSGLSTFNGDITSTNHVLNAAGWQLWSHAKCHLKGAKRKCESHPILILRYASLGSCKPSLRQWTVI